MVKRHFIIKDDSYVAEYHFSAELRWSLISCVHLCHFPQSFASIFWSQNQSLSFSVFTINWPHEEECWLVSVNGQWTCQWTWQLQTLNITFSWMRRENFVFEFWVKEEEECASKSCRIEKITENSLSNLTNYTKLVKMWKWVSLNTSQSYVIEGSLSCLIYILLFTTYMFVLKFSHTPFSKSFLKGSEIRSSHTLNL